MSVREHFVQTFGEEQAQLLEAAHKFHTDSSWLLPQFRTTRKVGSDPFKDTLAIVIGYQCVQKERFRKEHGITIAFEDFFEWVRQHGDLESHDGDFDGISLFAGVYPPWIPSYDDKPGGLNEKGMG